MFMLYVAEILKSINIPPSLYCTNDKIAHINKCSEDETNKIWDIISSSKNMDAIEICANLNVICIYNKITNNNRLKCKKCTYTKQYGICEDVPAEYIKTNIIYYDMDNTNKQKIHTHVLYSIINKIETA